MRFLAKRPDAHALALTYAPKGHNEAVRDALVADQHGFCAYSEARFDELATVAVEHFDHTLKGRDDATNWYAVHQLVNQRKRRREKEYAESPFFETRFFQVPGALQARVRFLPDENVFEEIDPTDGFLGFNDPEVSTVRGRHVRRLKDLFQLAELDAAGRIAWLRDHPEDLSFPTALAATLDLDLDALIVG